MANALKNVTIPLTGNLNMNRNESLTDSSFSIFNKQNSPVFGGSISPLHYTLNGTTDAKYSTDGSKWTVSGNALYRNDELFRSFSGSQSFDIVDTGKNYEGFVKVTSRNTETFAGLRINGKTIRIEELNSNLEVTNTFNLYTLSDTEKLTGFKLCTRYSYVFLILVYQNSSGSTEPMSLKVYRGYSNGTWSQVGSTYNFCFRKPYQNDETEKIEYETSTETTAVGQNFIALSAEMGNNFYLTVFKTRPAGVNTFKNIQFNTFELDVNGSPVREVTIMSGRNRSPRVKIDDENFDGKENRETLAFVVDNTSVVMAIGHVQNANDWSWCKMMASNATLVEGGTAHGYMRLYPAAPTDDTASYNTDCRYDAIFVENGSDKFTEIKTLGSSCLTTNYNGYGRLVLAGFGDTWNDGKGICPVVDVVYDAQFNEQSVKTTNGLMQTITSSYGLWNCGVTSDASIPTTKDGWNEWWSNREDSDNTCWNPAGMRAQIGGTSFYTLFNGREGNAVGISYASFNDSVGTLLTEWGSIVSTFENCATSDRVFFKDAKSNTVKYIVRKAGITLDDVEVFSNYVLVRCSAAENIYDISQDKWAKFANDWNNRLFTGYKNIFPYFNPEQGYQNNSYVYLKSQAVEVYSSSYAATASIAAGYDVAYVKEKGFSPSRLYAYNTLSGVVYGEVLAYGAELTSTNPLDFFASSGSSSPSYKCSYIKQGSSTCISNLAGSTYPITSSGSAYFNIPIIGSEIVDSYNGKYGLKIDDSCYTIAYDGIRPVALYNTSSLVDQVEDFFIVQSQYYALIKGFICSLSYSSSNNISGVEQIVCVDGMQFIGAFPSCAYFYSPAARAIFAFTGDADLQLFVQTDRITEVYASKYFPNCEWIFLSTNDGIYVMSQNNTFRLNEDFGRVKNFYPTKDDYCVMVLEDGRNVFLSMTKKEGWTTIPVEVETAFFCDGDMKKSTITDWYIRVFKGDEDYNGKVTCSAKTMNDIVSQTIKTFDGKVDVKLTKDKFDENDNSMITLHTGCNALGTSCKVVSDYPISYFGFTIGSDGSTAKSKYNI